MKEKVGRFTTPDIQIYYKVIVIVTGWYLVQETTQQNGKFRNRSTYIQSRPIQVEKTQLYPLHKSKYLEIHIHCYSEIPWLSILLDSNVSRVPPNTYTKIFILMLSITAKKNQKQIEWLSLVKCIKIEVYLSKRNTKFIKGNTLLIYEQYDYDSQVYAKQKKPVTK